MAVEVAGFDIEREIGRGGFGVVYLARQLAFNRPAAIKMLLPGLSADEIAKRFAQECRAVGSLRAHPNILTVYSTGVSSDGSPYLAMQYLGGGSLSERLPLPSDAVAALGVRLADGLAVAHAGGVIHRDVKPANILFDDDDEPVLVDFGISSLIGEASTTTGDVAVSIGYTPPEILGGAKPTVAADVYALGATLFSALTGRTPFVSGDGFTSIAVMAARILNAPVEDLRPAGVPDELCGVIETCMAKEPDDRYPSMTELRAALLPLADQATVRTPSALWGAPSQPPSDVSPEATTRPRRSTVAVAIARTHRRALAAAAVLVLLGGGIAAGAIVSGTDDASNGSPSAAAARHSLSAAAHPAAASRTSAARTGSTALRSPATTTAASSGPNVVIQPVTVPIGNGLVTVPGNPGGVDLGSGQQGAGSRPKQATNHAPVLGALTSISTGEQQSVSKVVSASDRDGGALRFQFSGLPPGVSANAGRISGTVPYYAVSATSDYRSLASRTYTVHVTVYDNAGAHDSGTFGWTVIDDHLAMPNYIGKYGCNGTPDGNGGVCRESVPNVSALGHHYFSSRYAGSYYTNKIVQQSVSPGVVVAWGGTFSYVYGS